MTSIRDRVIARRENMRGFTGVYDAEGHIEMARRLTVTPVNSRYQAPNRRLSDDQVLAIRQRHAAGNVSKQELAATFGVSNTTIHDIVIWKHYRDVEAADAG